MILPPFQGISSQYDEAEIREAIISFLCSDIATFTEASRDAGVTYLAPDVATFTEPQAIPSVTYLAADIVSLGELSTLGTVTYEAVDVLTYDPPPEVPEITRFLSTTIEDSRIDFTWNTPNPRRSPLTTYILEYTDCFLSRTLTEDEDNLILTDSQNYTTAIFAFTENGDQITAENTNNIIFEPGPAVSLISEHYKTTCNYKRYDHRRVLEEEENRIIGDTFLLTEQSSGIGLINSVNVDPLINGHPYIFRVAAVNAVGTGEYSYTNILSPIGPDLHSYCDIRFFLQPNSTTDIYTSLKDHSCREKDIVFLEGVTVSSESKFGAGSLAFDGVYHSLPTPGTRSHLQVDRNFNTTLDNWSLLGDFTVEMWIKPNSANDGTQSLISAANPYHYDEENYAETNIANWNLYRQGQKIKFEFKGWRTDDEFEGGGTTQTTTLETENLTLSTTEFSHIAVSKFNNRIRLYVNGEEKDKKTAAYGVMVTGQYMVIGAEQRKDYDSSDTFNTERGVVYNAFKGKIDDVMITDRARYARNFTPEKYAEPADCAGCGGYSVGATSASVSNEFIP
jgi:hypothetical protein|tara:strand:- start:2136 stop:3827 length:1692 start_codon:yes stop_codon:yes gene_type:complete